MNIDAMVQKHIQISRQKKNTTRDPLINDRQNLSWISKKSSQSHDCDENFVNIM